MNHPVFSPEHLQLLMRPELWQLHARGISYSSDPVDEPEHLAWSEIHAHAHPHREVLFILHGETRIGLAGMVFPCRPGTLLFFDAYEKHDNFYPGTVSDFDHLWLVFASGHLFANLVRMRKGKNVGTRVGDFPISSTGLSDLSRPLTAIWPGYEQLPPELRKMKLFLTIAQLVAFVIERSFFHEADPENRDSRQKQAVSRICEHVEACGGRGISLEYMAQLAGYSKFHFHRIFTDNTGESPKVFIDRCRIQAARALEEEGRSKKEIAYELGFSSPSAFSRWSRKHLLANHREP